MSGQHVILGSFFTGHGLASCKVFRREQSRQGPPEPEPWDCGRNLHLLPQTCQNHHRVTAQASKKSEHTASDEEEMGLNRANTQRSGFADENHICSYTHLSTLCQKALQARGSWGWHQTSCAVWDLELHASRTTCLCSPHNQQPFCNTNTQFSPPSSPERVRTLINNLRYHLTINLSLCPNKPWRHSDFFPCCIKEHTVFSGTAWCAVNLLTTHKAGGSSCWAVTRRPGAGCSNPCSRKRRLLFHYLSAPLLVEVPGPFCWPFILVSTLLCSHWFFFHLLHSYRRSGSSSALPKHTLSLRKSSRGRKWVTPANQEHNEGSSDFMLLCLCCLITCSSETKAHLSFLIQPSTHTNNVYLCLRIYITLQANKTGELSNVNNLRHGPEHTYAMVKKTTSLLTAGLFRRVTPLTDKSLCSTVGPSIEQCEQLTAGGSAGDGRRSRRPSERKNASKETNISGLYCRNLITLKNCQLF